MSNGGHRGDFSINDLPSNEVASNPNDDAVEAAEANELFIPPVGSVVRWRVAAALLKLRMQLNERHPNRAKFNDGSIGDAAHQSRDSDHNPWVRDENVGVVTAFDVTHDPASGLNCHSLAETLRSSRDTRIKYVIWNSKIFASYPTGATAAWSWRAYGGSNPHDKHLHISVNSDKEQFDLETAWPI
jgi:hypothetical protein